LSAEPQKPLVEINMQNSVYTSPVVANEVLYIANKTHLFAIAAGSESKSDTKSASKSGSE
jgi:hypothetical protein